MINNQVDCAKSIMIEDLSLSIYGYTILLIGCINCHSLLDGIQTIWIIILDLFIWI